MSSEASWVESMPEIYDRRLGPALFAPYAAYLADLAATFAPRRVLELAAGTGIATAALVSAVPAAEIVATDLNPAMVAWGQAHVTGASWQVADAEHLDFPTGRFDLVVCQFGVMFFPDKAAAFAETGRVLAPGGTALFAIWDVLDGSDFPAAMVASLAAVLPDDPPSFIVRVPHGYADPERIAADVEAGGLHVRRIDRVALRGAASSARDLADGFARGTPLRFALEQRGSLDDLTAALADQMQARLGDGPLDGGLAAFVITAVSAG